MRKFIRENVILSHSLIFTFGVGLALAYANLFHGKTWGLILNSLGTAIMGASLLSVLQNYFGIDIPSVLGEKLKLNQTVYDMGLLAIHSKRGDEAIFNRWEKARSIDLLYLSGGNTLHRYFDSLERALDEQGCHIRILLCSPTSLAVTDPNLSNGLCHNMKLASQVEEVTDRIIDSMRKLMDRDDAPQTGSLEIKHYNVVPTCSIIIVDKDVVRVTPFLPYSHSSAVPSFDLTANRKGGLYTQYQKTFDTIWKDAAPVFVADFSTRSLIGPEHVAGAPVGSAAGAPIAAALPVRTEAEEAI